MKMKMKKNLYTLLEAAFVNFWKSSPVLHLYQFSTKFFFKVDENENENEKNLYTLLEAAFVNNALKNVVEN